MRPLGLALGKGPGGLEVAVAEASLAPNLASLRTAWKSRLGGRATPLLLVVLYEGEAALCGPVGDHPPAFAGLAVEKVEQICRVALDEPDRHAALRFLHSIIQDVEEPLFGVRNEGLFATHELRVDAPRRQDWPAATERAGRVSGKRGRDLLTAMGFTVEQLPGPACVLRAGENRTALAVFLERQESPDASSARFSNLSAVSYSLAKADSENLPYVLLSIGPRLRLYCTKPGVGAGQRSRAETFVEIHLELLTREQLGYLWLLFSPDALLRGGTVEQILEDSARYAAELGGRLRERVYRDVIPCLAEGLLEARRLADPTVEDLAESYKMALVVLFRLLFIAYAEDKDLLPYRTNSLYRGRSLKQKARELIEIKRRLLPFDEGTTHWEEVDRLCRAVDHGNPEWGVPAYDGGLFSRDPNVSPLGAALAGVELPNRVFGRVLDGLLVEGSAEGWGPVDFRSLGVREFGTIYEGLLENELARAEVDLAIEKKDRLELFRPARPKDEVAVEQGRAYLRNTSGARKSTGSYFTKQFAVEHLLAQALEPALAEHLARLDALPDREAADAFFDFRVADIAMGSGHFLVAAVDRIEKALAGYLARRPLRDVLRELERLREAAMEALGPLGESLEIEDTQLLRRQIARRSIYGVDLNPIAVELARLSLWVHTFVPGLPLSFLDHNLVEGNSLVGIATVDEAGEWLKQVVKSLFALTTEELVGSARGALDRFGRLSDANAAEIAAARRAIEEASEAVKPAGALFDILAAARIDGEVFAHVQQRASHWKNEPETVLRTEAWKLARAALAAIRPFHFPVAFPEVFLRERPGFDVILGNPPWEEATVEEDRFWTRHYPGFHSLKQHEQEAQKRRYAKQRPDLVEACRKEVEQAELLRRVLVSGPFPGMGTGDPDVYKAFCWRFWNLARKDGGRIGVVLPRSAFATRGNEPFRKEVFSSGLFEDLTFLLNRGGWVFDDAEHRYTITLASWGKCAPSAEATMPLRGPYPTLKRYAIALATSPLRFPVADVLTWTDTAVLPLLPTEGSGEVFLQLRKSPRLDAEACGAWRALPHRELDATNDKKLMKLVEDRPEGYWPVFKGESFDIWEPDTGRYYAWADPDKLQRELQKKRQHAAKLARSPFSRFPRAWINDPNTLPCLSARIAFRDVTNRTNQRTVIGALLPPRIFITNTGPYLLWPSGDERDQAFLLGLFCSIPLDWYARRFVELHMNFHVMNAFPIPRPERSDPLWQRVVELAGQLACPDRRFRKWANAVGVEYGPLEEREKQHMIHELDAVVGHLYGLSEPQLRHIFETFHEGWDFAERMEATLEWHRKWQLRLQSRSSSITAN